MLMPIFIKESEQIAFERDGYLIVRKLLPKHVVGELRALYFKWEKLHLGDRLGMHSTAHTSNAEMLGEVYTELRRLTEEYADKHLRDYKFFLGSFLIKESRNDSLFDIHQDWTCVDEPQYCSLNFWMDLEGMNQNNGQLFFLKGTHNLAPNLRFPPQCPTPWNQVKKIAPLFYTYLYTEPGDVVFINNATLHGSVVNRSGRNRIAAILGVYSADAPLLIYYKDPNAPLNKIERYLVNTENLTNMPRLGRPPGAVFDGYATYNTHEVTPDEFYNFMMKQMNAKEKLTYYIRKIKS